MSLNAASESLVSCSIPDRFWSFVEPEPMSGCWLWIGSWAKKPPQHYGQFWYEGRLHRAHRLLYEVVRGPIAPGLLPDHLCRTPPCVRPSHLEPVTTGVNIARGLRPHTRAQHQRGDEHHNSKIREADLPQLLDLSIAGHSNGELAERFGVDVTTIQNRLRVLRGYVRPPKAKSSRFVGVYLAKGKWCAQVRRGSKPVYLGTFSTEREAADAVDAASHEREAIP